ncbi:hypothetical protein [Roseovarius salinarum]|uniref:hypothetical protein n=1 Tax=Roseovarius salinarum TaxID=1981892 RepID=UPI000C32B681|nr:hypothetical protein [Roseovarius salinarum]
MKDLHKELEALEIRIRAADPANRYKFQSQLHRLIEKLSHSGQPVPSKLRDLDDQLAEDAIEAEFDNMPV